MGGTSPGLGDVDPAGEDQDRGQEDVVLHHTLRRHRVVARRIRQHRPVLGKGDPTRQQGDHRQFQEPEPGQREGEAAEEQGRDAGEGHQDDGVKGGEGRVVTPQDDVPPEGRHAENEEIDDRQLAEPRPQHRSILGGHERTVAHRDRGVLGEIHSLVQLGRRGAAGRGKETVAVRRARYLGLVRKRSGPPSGGVRNPSRAAFVSWSQKAIDLGPQGLIVAARPRGGPGPPLGGVEPEARHRRAASICRHRCCVIPRHPGVGCGARPCRPPVPFDRDDRHPGSPGDLGDGQPAEVAQGDDLPLTPVQRAQPVEGLVDCGGVQAPAPARLQASRPSR